MPIVSRLLILLMALSLLVACGPSETQIQATVEAAVAGTQEAIAGATATAEADSCSDSKLVTYADDLEQLLDRYENQTEIVGATPRVGLGAPLQRLVDYEDEARELAAPDCLADYHAAVTAMMERYREGYQNFAAQGPDATTTNALAEGQQLMADIRGALPDIREGVLPGEIRIP